MADIAEVREIDSAVWVRIRFAGNEGRVRNREHERLQTDAQGLRRLLWCITESAGGTSVITRDALEDYPGDERAVLVRTDDIGGNVVLRSCRTTG